MIGVFIDTFVVLTITALVVISTLYVKDGVIIDGLTKNNLMQAALGRAFGSMTLGNVIVAVCLTFFAFTTIISWNFFGKQNVQSLSGKKQKIASIIYSVVAVAFIFLGSVFSSDLVWELTDAFNYLMVIPNALALFALSGMVVSAVKARKNKNETK